MKDEKYQTNISRYLSCITENKCDKQWIVEDIIFLLFDQVKHHRRLSIGVLLKMVNVVDQLILFIGILIAIEWIWLMSALNPTNHLVLYVFCKFIHRMTWHFQLFPQTDSEWFDEASWWIASTGRRKLEQGKRCKTWENVKQGWENVSIHWIQPGQYWIVRIVTDVRASDPSDLILIPLLWCWDAKWLWIFYDRQLLSIVHQCSWWEQLVKTVWHPESPQTSSHAYTMAYTMGLCCLWSVGLMEVSSAWEQPENTLRTVTHKSGPADPPWNGPWIHWAQLKIRWCSLV